MALVGFSVCQDLNTPLGSLGPPVDDRGVWEGWCELDADERWEVPGRFLGQQRITFGADCAAFGGFLQFVPDDPVDGERSRGGIMLRPDADINLRGKRLVTRVDPMRPPDGGTAFGFLAYWGAELMGADPWGRFEWFFPATGDPRLDLFIYDGSGEGETDEYIRLTPYEPDGAHRWFSLRHDIDTDTLHLETSADCATWVTQLSGAMVTGGIASILLELYMEAEKSGGGWTTNTGTFSEVYIVDSAPAENGNGGGD
jgi:hypothetical protein